MPTLSLIAGPNGSGKSTLTWMVWFEGNEHIIDADAIAKRIDPLRPATAAISAAREAILLCRNLLADMQSFTLETTLAGNGALATLREAKSRGYRTYVCFVALRTPELHIERVRSRVMQGGHDIPDNDVRRRYGRSLTHAPEADVFDNSGIQPERMLMLRSGRIVWSAENLPGWVEQLRAAIERLLSSAPGGGAPGC